MFAVNRKRGLPARLVMPYLGRNDREARGRSEDSKHRVRLYVMSLKEKQLEFITSFLPGRDVVTALPTVHAVNVTFYDVTCIPREQVDGTYLLPDSLLFA